jgi:hypothetical protein
MISLISKVASGEVKDDDLPYPHGSNWHDALSENDYEVHIGETSDHVLHEAIEEGFQRIE